MVVPAETQGAQLTKSTGWLESADTKEGTAYYVDVCPKGKLACFLPYFAEKSNTISMKKITKKFMKSSIPIPVLPY